jgi:hypothetical protein
MNPPAIPSNVREALLAEALGDLAQPLQRAEAVQQALAVSTADLREAWLPLAAQMAALDRELGSLTRKAQSAAVRHILERTDQAARAVFAKQVQPALQRLTVVLQQQGPARSAWSVWGTHGLALVFASGCSWAMAAWHWAGPR